MENWLLMMKIGRQADGHAVGQLGGWAGTNISFLDHNLQLSEIFERYFVGL